LAGLRVLLLGAQEIAKLLLRRSGLFPHGGVVGAELDRLGVIGGGLVPLLQRGVGPPALGKMPPLGRLRRDQVSEVEDGGRPLAALRAGLGLTLPPAEHLLQAHRKILGVSRTQQFPVAFELSGFERHKTDRFVAFLDPLVTEHLGQAHDIVNWPIFGGQAPHPDRAVSSGGDHPASIRTEGRVLDGPPMLQGRGNWLTGPCIPDLCHAGIGPRQYPGAIGTEPRLPYRLTVLQGRRERLSRSCMPDPRRLVRAGRDDPLPVLGKLGMGHIAAVVQRSPQLARSCVPQTGTVVFAPG